MDRERERVVWREETEALALELGAVGVVESSAFTGAGVERSFRCLAQAIKDSQARWEAGGLR